MSMKTLYKTDPAANETGVWVSYPANSDENVIAILSDPEWAELYEDLRERARKAALFRLAQQEREAKN
jgi:hypothetical protein